MFSQFCVSHFQHHARLPWWNANTSTKTRLNLRHSCSNLINCAHTERILNNRSFPFPILEVTVSSAVLYVLQWSFECIINLPLCLFYHIVWHCTSSTKHIHTLCCLSNELQRILFVYYGVYIFHSSRASFEGEEVDDVFQIYYSSRFVAEECHITERTAKSVIRQLTHPCLCFNANINQVSLLSSFVCPRSSSRLSSCFSVIWFRFDEDWIKIDERVRNVWPREFNRLSRLSKNFN